VGGWTRDPGRKWCDGHPVVLTDELVRATYGGRGPRQNPQTGLAAAEGRWDELLESVKTVERSVALLAAVPNTAGRPFLDEEGWPEAEVEPVRRKLDRIDRRLATWQDRWIDRREDDAQEQD
jgi:hypothetical protein